jgi:hypothetical protein
MDPKEEAELKEAQKKAAAANGARNSEQLSVREQIARNMDARRSAELEDTADGAQPTGRFAEGEFDDSPEARERAAEIADREAEEALAEERQAADAAQERRARELQAEGADDQGQPSSGAESQAGDEKVIGGVRYYLTIVNGKEKWLTLEQLRAAAQKTDAADVALQRAQEAVQKATQLALGPQTPSELGQDELEDVIASAALGDSDAVKKLASVLKSRPSATPADVGRQVEQQLATQRAIDQAEREQAEILRHASLSKYFRVRLSQLAQSEPDLQIIDAYRKIGSEIRQEFAPMLRQSQETPPSKEERKRSLSPPPRAASRAVRVDPEDDEEESPSAVADRMAKARGQQRAIRHGRIPG